MQFSSLVADGSSRGDVGMQIAISHEVCAVSKSCFFYYGKSWNGKKYPFSKCENSDMESSCWWQQQEWSRDANCYFSWSVCSKQKLFLLLWQAVVCCRSCDSRKWLADSWGWLDVRRSAMLHYTVNQHHHWACWQYGHSGGTHGWLSFNICQLCLQDTSRSANCHRRAAGGERGSISKIFLVL